MPRTVYAILGAAMMVTMVAMTTARPMTAPMLITPASNDDHVVASAMKVLEGVRHASAAGALKWPA
eukprot:3833585-Pyramimonas_sp.AAC.1